MKKVKVYFTELQAEEIQEVMKKERIEKQEELVRELRRAQAGRKYAERLQGSVPGKEASGMRWMRDLLSQQLCC